MILNRIAALRNYMNHHNLDTFIIPSTDPHQSEYVADHWKVRTYFSGFTGSAGILIITQKVAALWTDSRYFLQFEDECGNSEIELYKQSIPHAPEHIPWLCNLLNKKDTIGIDFRQFSKSQIDYLKDCIGDKEIQLKNHPHFTKEIWLDRPSLPKGKVSNHSLEFSGESAKSKLAKVQLELKKQKADYYFFSSLDEIAWLFNIRATDVDFTPLVTSYALVGVEETILFCNCERFSQEHLEELKSIGVSVLDYDEVAVELPKLSKETVIVTDVFSLNYACYNAIQGSIVHQNSVVKEWKSIKNTTEINGAISCMKKDGVALTKFFMWLEESLQHKKLSEYEIGRKLESFRAEQERYSGESFAAIVGYKGNGAIIHYTAPKEKSALVEKKGILLIDSGAQYKDGTTDITRTLWLGGEPSEAIKQAYTAVLKGYISLEQISFPEGTIGVQLDVLARMHLWQEGLSYPHGTGHGIGSFGMVHEPEQGFATSGVTSRGTAIHKENQLTTIEPGCYVAGEFGIRIENIVLSKFSKKTQFGTFLKFEPLTLSPIDTQLILVDKLSEKEIQWLNEYHQKVYDTLSGLLNKEECEWLKEKCKKI
ncbi:aminopeptidase P family protein [Tenacibaculum holothuriorum]|nr:aminopeptidase P family protein [Tenacibaculum holothuriorum]